MIDIHCHILPNLDDGPENLEEAIKMCHIAFDEGIKSIIATPHTMNGYYINNRQTINKAVNKLNFVLKDNHINLAILPGAEVHVNYNIMDLINQGTAMTLNDQGKYLMLEFPVHIIPPRIKDQIFKLKLEGITPIFAHPERNINIQNNINIIHELVMQGGLTQITAMSLTGEFGPAPRQCAQKMLELNLAHIIASDAHSASLRAPRLKDARDIASEIVGNQYAQKMVIDFPYAIIKGLSLDDQLPEPKEPTKSFFQRLFNISR